jgi:hypothetical protein
LVGFGRSFSISALRGVRICAALGLILAVSWAKLAFTFVPAFRRFPVSGSGGFNFSKKGVHFLDLVVLFLNFPRLGDSARSEVAFLFVSPFLHIPEPCLRSGGSTASVVLSYQAFG